MKAVNLNHLWAKLIVEELVRCGIRKFSISPGSRSTPLTVAAAEHHLAETIVHTDERGSAFSALGFAKASGTPAALICTSGTALANVYPAVIEASLSCTPLVVISSDRPPELRDSGAPQAIDQVKMFADYLRWQFDLPTPGEEIAPSLVLTTIDQAIYRATDSPAGPVQLNCMFREPLAPLGRSVDFGKYLTTLNRWLDNDISYTEYTPSVRTISRDQLERIAQIVDHAQQGIIVAGGLPVSENNSVIIDLAEKLGWPLIADITSQLRCTERESAVTVARHDSYLRSDDIRRKLRPDVVLQFGSLPTSRSLLDLVAESDSEYLVIENNPFRHDPIHRVTGRIHAEPHRFAHLLNGVVKESKSNVPELFSTADSVAEEVLKSELDKHDNLTEPMVARAIRQLSEQARGIFLANSLPIRECDAFSGVAGQLLHIGSNRGANGIDGTIASAVGFAAGLGNPVTLLIGDLAFLHDLNSLALVRGSQIPITIVVLNNNGGGIFSFLPVAEIGEHFEKFFATPHGLTFEYAARMFNLDYYTPATRHDFESCYQQQLTSDRSAVIEIKTDREANVRLQRELVRSICDKVESAIC